MPLTFKYLDVPFGLGGRGGVQRFFLLAHNIDFTEELVELSDWGATEKARVLSSGENPCAALPIIYNVDSNNNNNESPHLIQHVAALRYLARVHGITKDNTAYEEYVQDLVADEYQSFRDMWARIAFEGSDDEKAKYKTEQVPPILEKFDKLYAKYKLEESFLSVSKTDGQPLWADAGLYGLLRDNMITGFLTMEDLKEKYSHLATMFEAFGSIPAVKEWVDKQ